MGGVYGGRRQRSQGAPRSVTAARRRGASSGSARSVRERDRRRPGPSTARRGRAYTWPSHAQHPGPPRRRRQRSPPLPAAPDRGAHQRPGGALPGTDRRADPRRDGRGAGRGRGAGGADAAVPRTSWTTRPASDARTCAVRARSRTSSDSRPPSTSVLPDVFAAAREVARRKLGDAPLRRAADGRDGAPPGPHRGDEDRRGQDAGGARSRRRSTRCPAGASTWSRSTTTSPSATRSGWVPSSTAWACRWASSSTTARSCSTRPTGQATSGCCTCARCRGRRPTRRTSPTPPTTSWASTTCATTWSRSSAERVQRDRYFAIVDEVDNILIDEARTPLIISGQAEESGDLYYTVRAPGAAAQAATGG